MCFVFSEHYQAQTPFLKDTLNWPLLTKKDIINLIVTDDSEGKTTDLTQIRDIKYVLRLTKKESEAEADPHHDCCMFLSRNDYEDSTDSDDLTDIDDKSSEERFE